MNYSLRSLCVLRVSAVYQFFIAHSPQRRRGRRGYAEKSCWLILFFEEEVADEGFICRTAGLDVVVELETGAETGE